MHYVELHARSAFSFLEGASLPELLMARCAQLGMPAMALLDRNGLYGAPRFHMAARARRHACAHRSRDCRARCGRARASSAWLPHRVPAEPVRFALLAETQTGYQNLCRLITRYKLREAHKAEGAALLADVAEYRRRPRLPDRRRRRPAGGGPGARRIRRGPARGRATGAHLSARAMSMSNCSATSTASEEHRNQAAVRIARALHLPLLATNGVNYATAYEREVLDVLTTIRHHCTLETAGRLLAPNAERYLRSAARDAGALPRSSRGHRQHRASSPRGSPIR